MKNLSSNLYQNNVSGFNGNVSPSPNCDSHIGGNERWGIVYTISDHGNLLTTLLQILDFFHFVGRKDLGEDILYPKLKKINKISRIMIIELLKRMQYGTKSYTTTGHNIPNHTTL